MRYQSTKFKQTFFGLVAAVLLLLLGAVPSASADDTTVSQVVIFNDTNAAADSTLRIEFDAPLSENAARQVKSTLGDTQLIEPRGAVTPPFVYGPTINQNISCRMGNYRFSDTNDAFQIRNNCFYNNAN